MSEDSTEEYLTKV